MPEPVDAHTLARLVEESRAERDRYRETARELWDALARAVDHDNACPDDGTCDLCRLRNRDA